MVSDKSRIDATGGESPTTAHTGAATDYLSLMLAECRDLAAFLDTLSAKEWEAPSLCRGWQVRDVIAHMAVGHTTPVLSMAAALARHRFRMDQTSFALATGYARSHTPAQILARFREGTAGPPRAATRLVPVHELFTDHLVHHQDIRRPLGMPRQIPQERSLAALHALHRMRTVRGRARMRGLHVVATDVDRPGGRPA